MVIMGFITVLFAAFSILMLCGKGAFLIAGYNTSSKEEQEKYDEKKLCRVVGAGMGAVAIASALLMVFGTDSVIFTRIFVIVIFIAIIAMLVLTNTCCYSEKYKNHPELFQSNKKTSKVGTYVIVGISVVVGIFVFVMLETGDVKYQYGDTSVKAVASYWSDETFDYDSIEEITYRTDVKVGDRVSGLGSFRLNLGRFSNDEFGRYTLYSYVNCKEFVELKTTDGIVMLNGVNPEATREIYDTLSQKIKK